MESKNKFCQCCGMPMKKDTKHGGTNSDGTVEEMQEFCKSKMIEQGTPKFVAWVFTRGMKRLDRWKNK